MAEIRRSPVEVGSLSHYLQGFSTIPGSCLGFQPSTVVFQPNHFQVRHVAVAVSFRGWVSCGVHVHPRFGEALVGTLEPVERGDF